MMRIRRRARSADGFIVGWLQKVDRRHRQQVRLPQGIRLRALLLRHLRSAAARLRRVHADRLRRRRRVTAQARKYVVGDPFKTETAEAQRLATLRRRGRRRRPQRPGRGRVLRASRPAHDRARDGATSSAARRSPSSLARLSRSLASYVCSLLDPQVVADLDLAAHGYHAYRKDPASFTPLADGRSLLLGARRRRERARDRRASTRATSRASRRSTREARVSARRCSTRSPTTSRRSRASTPRRARRSKARRRLSSSATCDTPVLRQRSQPTA